ncbi:MAG: DUF2079 domain-containing protein [Anaerolineae bacterium]|nr:MAG: DUF2079 domain-containing protein [Anaerolineae bacterium]
MGEGSLIKVSKRVESEQLAWWVVVVLTVLYIAFFATLSIRQHRAFTTHGFDLGNADQAVWNTLHGRFLRMTNELGTENRLGTHFDPLIALLAPLYLVYSSPETLLIVQTVALALGGWPIFWLTKEKLSSAWGGVVFTIVYLAFPALESANLSEFHAVTLGASFLTWAFYSLHQERRVRFLIFALLAMMCKEHLSLIVGMMGLYALFVKRKKWGLGVLLAGLLWFIIAVKVIIPSFNESGRSIHLAHYCYLGRSVEEVVINAVTRPHLVLDNFRDELKVAYLIRLFFPVGYLSLLAPQVLLLAAPSILINFLSSHSNMYALDMFWNSVDIVPFVVLSAGWGVALLVRLFHRLLKVKQAFVVAVLAGYALILTAFYHQRFGYLPLGKHFWWPEITSHHRLGAELAGSIPQDAVVVAQDLLNPHVSQRETIYVFPDNLDKAEYVFLDVSVRPGYVISEDRYHAAVRRLLDSEDLGLIVSQDGYLIFQRGAERVPLSEEFYSFTLVESLGEAMPVAARFGDSVRLSGLRTFHQRGSILQVHSYWQAIQVAPDDVHLFICLVDGNGQPYQATVREMRASIWLPPSRWGPESLIYDRAAMQLPAYVDLSTISLGLFVGPPLAVEDATARLPLVIEDAGAMQARVVQGVLVIPLW